MWGRLMSKTWRLLLLTAGTFIFAVLALVLASSQPDASTVGTDHSTPTQTWTSASR